MKHLIKEHKGMQRDSHFYKGIFYQKKYLLEAEHAIDINDEEIIITAAIKMKKEDPRCKKLIEKMEQKQVSPVREVLGQIERENRHNVEYGENGASNLYSVSMKDLL